ncbi:MAG: type II methionyl aminopeptidase [Candidatus Pacearchaeota archaeon]
MGKVEEKVEEKGEIKDYKTAGKLLEQTLSLAKKICKKEVLLLKIAEQLENFIEKSCAIRAALAFPPNLSINEIAAHYSPFTNDTTLASGLLKVDIGVRVNDCIADAAISLDLEGSEENKELIKTAKEALKAALQVAKPEVEVCEIGKAIEEKINEFGFRPIYNLTGHEISKTSLHGGKTIPNYNNNDKTKLEENDVIAIEPFVTLPNASGSVVNGKPSAIWILKKLQKPRTHREIYEWINKNFNSFPFSQRWLKFENASIALKLFESQGLVYNYPELVEKTGAKVSQAETTIIIKEKPIILTNIFDI